MSATRPADAAEAALAAAFETADAGRRAQLLMEIAAGLQQDARAPDHIAVAIGLYDHALDACPAEDLLLRARILARQGSALQIVPGPGIDALEAARGRYEAALPDLRAGGREAEIAEVEMNLGLVLQSLAGASAARLTDAIAAYRRALRVFDAQRYPVEYAIVQSNLATASLLLPDATPPSRGAPGANRAQAQAYYEDAYRIFVAHGETERAALLAGAMAELAAET